MIKIPVPSGSTEKERELLRTIERALNTAGPVLLPSYTVAQATELAATTANCLIMVSDETGGAVPAFSDGTNYRRVTDRAIVS